MKVLRIMGEKEGWKIEREGGWSFAYYNIEEIINIARREGVKKIITEGGWSEEGRREELEKLGFKRFQWGEGFIDYYLDL